MVNQSVPAVRQSFMPSGVTSLGEGFEGLDQQDLILPRMTILQPTSKKDGKEGEFHNNLTGECLPSLEAVILKVNRTRTLWSGDLGDTRPECQSYDGLVGRVYGPCEQCQFNPEVNAVLWEEKNLKRCNRGYLFLCLNPKDEAMFLLSAMGTSVKPARILISQLVQKVRSAFGALVRFETSRVVDDKGKYYVLKPTVVKAYSQAEVVPYREMSRSLQAVAIHEVDEGAEAEEPSPESGPAGDGRLPF